MKFYVYKEATGEILRTGEAPASMVAMQAEAGQVVAEGEASAKNQWVNYGQLEPRPEMPLIFDDPLTAVEGEYIRVGGIPPDTTCTLPETTTIVDDGYIEWTSLEAGEYYIRLSCFPHKEVLLNATITSL